MKSKSILVKKSLALLGLFFLATVVTPASSQLKLPNGESLAPTPRTEAAPTVETDPAILAKEEAASAKAEEWLALLDTDKFAESWQETSALFRQRVPKDVWLAQLPSARKPFGKLKERKLEGYNYKTTLPGVPEGEYVTLIFHSSFDVKSEAAETVTMAKDSDGAWRATGYFIR